MKNSIVQPTDRSVTQLLIYDISRDTMTETEHRTIVDFWFTVYEKYGFCERFSSPFENEKRHNGKTFKVLTRCGEDAYDLEVLPLWRIQLENGIEIHAYPEEICKLELNSTNAAEGVVTELIRRARTATPVDYESMALVLHKYGRDLYTKALNTVLDEISGNEASSPIPVLPSPCPVCHTNEYVYVIPSKTNDTRFQCICNACGMGESLLDSATEEEAVDVWNLKQATLQNESDKLKKEYEQFKLQWMIDHGYTLTDLVAHLDMMIHEDHAEETGVRTSLPSLFEDWEYGVGFAGGAVWPCFEEWLRNNRK